VKASHLKSLQGYLWVNGYESGEIRCPLFPDVAPAFDAWHKAGIPIIIYSSGSVAAQKLLFQYTDAKPGDMRGMISGYFDTVNAGMKREKSSYEKIAASRKEDIGNWLFLSDQVQEVEAAKVAGMQSLIVVREGNVPLSDGDKRHALIQSFDEINIQSV
jgi:enolase-phosphatase E1